LKLLLDEMFSPAIAQALRARGHDVQALKERTEWIGLSDRDVVALARREQRAVVTANVRDYRQLHAELTAPGGAGHYGLVLLPTTSHRTKADVGRLVTALLTKLTDYPGEQDLANGETWL
jgi:Domain of unknown function (DUF5615)